MIPFLDLKSINSSHKVELQEAASEVINSGWYLNGEQLKNFENELSIYNGNNHIIGVSNGLDALRLILRGYIELGHLEEGDEVIIPGHTFIATLLPLFEFKLKPILIDIDPNTYNLDLNLLISEITNKTKAIILVHLYGRIVWSDKLLNIAKEKNILVIEDNAQAIGARHNNIKSGNLGDASAFSFYPGKNLGALGDAGAIGTNDPDLANIIRSIANYGSSIKYNHEYLGYNCRLDEIQAAFLRKKLIYLDSENKRRRDIASSYLSNIKNPKILLPHAPEYPNEHVWHLFVVQVEERDKFQEYLLLNNIETLIHYPIAIHNQKATKLNVSLPNTESLVKKCVSLPLYPTLSTTQISEIIEALNEF
jgi:dTDP-4-amino-4,6-dideoxygalactose transaminase